MMATMPLQYLREQVAWDLKTQFHDCLVLHALLDIALKNEADVTVHYDPVESDPLHLRVALTYSTPFHVRSVERHIVVSQSRLIERHHINITVDGMAQQMIDTLAAGAAPEAAPMESPFKRAVLDMMEPFTRLYEALSTQVRIANAYAKDRVERLLDKIEEKLDRLGR